jgi:hypothetical protein
MNNEPFYEKPVEYDDTISMGFSLGEPSKLSRAIYYTIGVCGVWQIGEIIYWAIRLCFQ